MRQRIHVHSGIERRASEPIPLVWICTFPQEVGSQIEVTVGDRHDQRADFFRIGQVQVRARLDDSLRALDTAFTGRKQKGRQASDRPVKSAWFARDLPFPIVDFGPGIDIRAVRDQLEHHLGLLLRGSPH